MIDFLENFFSGFGDENDNDNADLNSILFGVGSIAGTVLAVWGGFTLSADIANTFLMVLSRIGTILFALPVGCVVGFIISVAPYLAIMIPYAILKGIVMVIASAIMGIVSLKNKIISKKRSKTKRYLFKRRAIKKMDKDINNLPTITLDNTTNSEINDDLITKPKYSFNHDNYISNDNYLDEYVTKEDSVKVKKLTLQ